MKQILLLILCACTIQISAQQLKVIVVLDKSGSMGSIDEHPKINDIKPLLEHIKQQGGEVAFSIIGNNSKYYLKKYRHSGKGTELPIKKPGMTNTEYQKLLLQFAKEKKKSGNSGSISSFLESKDIQNVFSLDYGGGSDVAGAVELAQLYLAENDPMLTGAKKVAIFVTDGQNNSMLYNAPSQFCCDVIVVHRSANIGVLQKYNPQITTSLRIAVNSILP